MAKVNAHYSKLAAGYLFPEIAKRTQEFIVANPDAQIRQLLDWCAIPFEAECLSPHRQKRLVATASALQVREPIHRGALQRWKQFESELRPLQAALAQPDPDFSLSAEDS